MLESIVLLSTSVSRALNLVCYLLEFVREIALELIKEPVNIDTHGVERALPIFTLAEVFILWLDDEHGKVGLLSFILKTICILAQQFELCPVGVDTFVL